MNDHFQSVLLSLTGASSLTKIESIQSLWSGYGEIARYALVGGSRDSVVVKHVKLPVNSQHPRGWNTDLSHQRKVRSYHVECAWYQDFSALCQAACRVPHCLGVELGDDEFLMVLEDLDASGFSIRKSSVDRQDVNACLRWLANFHATFMGRSPKSLWPTGTYWHLDTRPDELEALDDLPLKAAAFNIDQALENCVFQTLVHGDAKLANFCFSEDGQGVAAVDFQYVGGGCGMKDVAYFIGSCFDETECERYEKALLDIYFAELREALAKKHNAIDPLEVERSWRPMFRFAWADFHRFLKGWSPGHWKINDYSERMTTQVLRKLGEG